MEPMNRAEVNETLFSLQEKGFVEFTTMDGKPMTREDAEYHRAEDIDFMIKPLVNLPGVEG